MSFLKFLRTTTSELPNAVNNGYLYFVKQDRAIFMDQGNERVRYTVQADWNQTNTNHSAYIANKPTTIAGYGITDAVQKVSGKGLSTNDYTTAEKNKLAGIAAGAEVNVNSDWNAVSGDAQILNKPGNATTSTPGFMSAADKTKLNGIAAGAEVNINADWTASSGDAQILHKPTSLAEYGVEDEVESKVERYSEYGVDTAEGNPVNLVTKAPQKAKHTVIDFEPIQDLHGYDHPWPGGGGKNLLPMTVEGIKTANTSGTWSGNDYTINGMTFTILVDSDNNILGIKANGTASADITIVIATTCSASESVILKGLPTAGSDNTFHFYITVNGSTYKQQSNGGSVYPAGTYTNIRFYIKSGYNAQNIIITPIICFSSESDTSFEPYSNICPISGVDKVEVDARYSLAKLSYIGPYDTDGTIQNVTTTYVSTNVVPCSPSTQYTVSSSYNITQVFVVSWDNQGQFIARDIVYNSTAIKQYTFTTRNNAAKLGITIRYTFTITSLDSIGNFQLEKGSEATSYIEPHITKLDLPETVYGGTLDLESGELVCDYGMVDLGTLTWTYKSNYLTFEATLSNSKTGAYREVANILCEQYASMSHATLDASSYGCAIGSSTTTLIVKDASYTDATTFKTAMSGVQLAYELATPQTYHLTPAQLSLFRGTNNISTNAKKLTVTYNKGELALIEDIYHEVSTFEQKSEASNPVTIETDSAQYAKATHLTLEPIQDLHGYDKPWPGGGGKNKLKVISSYVSNVTATNTDDPNVFIVSKTTTGSYCYFDINSYVPYADLGLEPGVTYIYEISGVDSNIIAGIYVNYRASASASATNYQSTAITTTKRSFVAPSSTDTGILYFGVAIVQTATFSNVKFEFSVYKASETNYSYEPYSNICPIKPMGHRNLLPMTVDGIKALNTSGTWMDNTYTYSGITFTIGIDNGGNITSIKTNGTASETSGLIIRSTNNNLFGNYSINGCPSGGSDNTYRLDVRDAASNVLVKDIGNGNSFTVDGTSNIWAYIRIQANTTVSNLVFKPMIRPTSDPDSSFVPYGVTKIGVESCGKNLWNESIAKWVENQLINAQGDIASNGYFKYSQGYYRVKGNEQYSLSFDKTSVDTTSTLLAFYDSNCNFISRIEVVASSGTTGRLTGTLTTPINAVYCRLCISKLVANIQLEEGSTATFYEPYISSSSSITLPEDVYSGTLDMETGELVVDRICYTFTDGTKLTEGIDGDANWLAIYHYIGVGANIFNVDNSVRSKNICSHVPFTFANVNGKPHFYNVQNGTQFFVPKSQYATLEAFISSLATNPLTYVAYLVTPRTYHLTPAQLALLKGTNNISTNAKTVQVTYRNGVLATLEDVVDSTEVAKQSVLGEASEATDNKIAESLVPILGNFATSESSPAIANHAVGEYLIYGDKLYKVISAIAAGETLTVGTNISATTVAAEFGSVNIIVNKLMPSATAGAHNGIYRGKDISSYFSDGSLWSRINGTSGYTLFEDLYVGDYITISGRSYTIVDFDYYIRCGDTDFDTHHLVMMPTGTMSIPAGTVLYNPNSSATQETLTFINTANAGVTVTYQETATAFKWNATMEAPNTSSTNGGYKYSRMRTVIMRAADTIIVGDFGASHVKAINPLYPNPSDANASGLASEWAWFNNTDWTNPLRKSICDLPNETQVYGQQVWGRGSAYTNVGYEVGVDKFQFAIFALHRNFADIRSDGWLRSVSSASQAACVYANGHASNGGASFALGVRPRFIIS